MNVKLICPRCDKKFERRKAEFNRSQKLGRISYCSRKCASKDNIENIPPKSRIHPENLRSDNRSDKYSDYKWYIKVCKQRKQHDFDLTLEYLDELWKGQQGKCLLSGVDLELRTHNSKSTARPNAASLDRIDSSKGYVKGNVRFISFMANMAKHTFSDEDVIEFCKRVVECSK